MAGSGAGSAAAAASPKDTVTIGAALSLTGSLAREGALTREGYELLRRRREREGRRPRRRPAPTSSPSPTRTTQSDARHRRRASSTSSTARGIKLILGPYGSASHRGRRRRGRAQRPGDGGRRRRRRQDLHQGLPADFAVLSPASMYLAPILQAVAELYQAKPQTVAIISADDGFSKTAAEGGAGRGHAARACEVVGVEYVPNATTDVSGALTKIRPHAAGPRARLGAPRRRASPSSSRARSSGSARPAASARRWPPRRPTSSRTLGASAEGVLGSAQWTPDVPGRDDWFGNAADYAAGFRGQVRPRAPTYHNAEATAACLAMVDGHGAAGIPSSRTRCATPSPSSTSTRSSARSASTRRARTPPSRCTSIQIQDGKVVTVWPRGRTPQPLRWPAPAAADTGHVGGSEFLQATVYGLLQGGLSGTGGRRVLAGVGRDEHREPRPWRLRRRRARTSPGSSTPPSA